MILKYFQELRSGIETKLLENPVNTNAREKYVLETAKLGTRLFSRNNKIAWCALMTPYEILNAMGITSCYVELIGGFLSSKNAVGPLITIAEQEGYPVESCAYHKGITGAMLQGMIPEPEFIIGASSPCIGGFAILENMARKFNKDLFILDVPQEETNESIKYLSDQIKNMVKFISEHTGKSLDPESLKQAVIYTNQTRKLKIEIYNLLKQIPSPANPYILRDFGFVSPVFDGTKAMVDICETFIEEFQNTINAGLCGVTGENIRLLWIQNRIQFKCSIKKTLMDEFKVNIFDDINDINWEPIDPDDPYIGFAKRMLCYPLNFNAEKKLELLLNQVKEFKIDGVINPCNWGCRQVIGIRGLINNGLKEIGIPVLNLEVDCVDSRNLAEGQVRTRLEAFLEMLSHNKRVPLSQST